MIRLTIITALIITVSACSTQESVEIESSTPMLITETQAATAKNENSRRGELGGGIREESDYGTETDYEMGP